MVCLLSYNLLMSKVILCMHIIPPLASCVPLSKKSQNHRDVYSMWRCINIGSLCACWGWIITIIFFYLVWFPATCYWWLMLLWFALLGFIGYHGFEACCKAIQLWKKILRLHFDFGCIYSHSIKSQVKFI